MTYIMNHFRDKIFNAIEETTEKMRIDLFGLMTQPKEKFIGLCIRLLGQVGLIEDEWYRASRPDFIVNA